MKSSLERLFITMVIYGIGFGLALRVSPTLGYFTGWAFGWIGALVWNAIYRAQRP